MPETPPLGPPPTSPKPPKPAAAPVASTPATQQYGTPIADALARERVESEARVSKRR